MKPHLLKLTLDIEKSFGVRRDVVPHFYNKWHYHPELELVLIERGTGTQFIGDLIENFRNGDLILIGKNLPHYWRCDDIYFKSNPDLKTEATVVHFTENFWGDTFIELPENKAIKELFEKAKRGMKITGKTKITIRNLMGDLLHCEGTDRLICLLKILKTIANSSELIYLASLSFNFSPLDESDNDRINRIYSYTLANALRKISLEEIAEIANLTPHSFCRYFKSRTRKTFSKFLMEVRIGHACKLLISGNLNVAQICFDSGFNNFANFNRQFKAITHLTPLQYQRQYLNK